MSTAQVYIIYDGDPDGPIDRMAHAVMEGAASVDGASVLGIETMCTDPLPPRLEVNFRIPKSTTLGWHRIEIQTGSRRLHPHPLQVDYESS